LIREISSTFTDLSCDFCSSKLSDFIDEIKNQPKDAQQAYKTAAVFGWVFKAGWELCPTCSR
jgi:hypothetical protein